jgi:carboxyl-terminal processing protease
MALKKIALSISALSLLAACGGGGSGGSTTAKLPETTQALAQMCAPENVFKADADGPTKPGSMATEKGWIKAYFNERYYWQKDIPNVNANGPDFSAKSYQSLVNYFFALKTPLKTATGAPVDKFSFMASTKQWNDVVTSVEMGYGWMLKSAAGPAGRTVKVAYVYPNSPAMAAGVARGDEIISVDGVFANETAASKMAIFEEGTNPTRAGSHRFILSKSGVTQEKTLTPQQIDLQEVEHKLVTSNGKTAGYLLFNSHMPNAEDYLVTAMSYFKEQGVKDLVVDLRYNGGGVLDIANALAHSIAGESQAKGKVFAEYKFSEKRMLENHKQAFISTGLFNQVYPSLGLSKIYVLVSEGTCSASEAFVNSLRGIDVEVELIGGKTCGKPYAFVAQDNCGLTYAAMEIEITNAKGTGGYEDGMVPQCVAKDDLTRALGDPAEGMLAVAFARMQGQSCTRSGPLALASTSLAGLPPQDDGVLMAPQWRKNAFPWKLPAK